MAVYTLEFNDFSNDDYTLIGIHTSLNDYKLAYLLNKHLQINFVRASYNLDFTQEKNQASYTVYEHSNTENDFDWFLISNTYKTTLTTTPSGFFNENEYKMYLVPEKKKVDFFLKIKGEIDFEHIVKTIEKINQIPQIITSYKVEVESLKSKDFLIF